MQRVFASRAFAMAGRLAWLLYVTAACASLGACARTPAARSSTPQCSLVGADALTFGGLRYNATLVPSSAVCLGASRSGGACVNRTFSITLPDMRYYGGPALPLAFALHGGEENAAAFLDGGDGGRVGALPIDVQLAAAGFVTLAPDGLPNPLASSILAAAGAFPTLTQGELVVSRGAKFRWPRSFVQDSAHPRVQCCHFGPTRSHSSTQLPLRR